MLFWLLAAEKETAEVVMLRRAGKAPRVAEEPPYCGALRRRWRRFFGAGLGIRGRCEIP
jgi:hypothetical protein